MLKPSDIWVKFTGPTDTCVIGKAFKPSYTYTVSMRLGVSLLELKSNGLFWTFSLYRLKLVAEVGKILVSPLITASIVNRVLPLLSSSIRGV